MQPVLSPSFFPPRSLLPHIYVLSTKETEDQEKDTSIYNEGFLLILFIFIVVPFILIILKLLSPTNAHFIEHIKC
jgi:hypothetical protein